MQKARARKMRERSGDKKRKEEKQTTKSAQIPEKKSPIFARKMTLLFSRAL
jgi:hypothetical protein